MNLPCTPIISADGHLNETATLIERLPERYRPFLMPKAILRDDGKVDVDILGNKLVLPRQKVLPQEDGLTPDELMCEFAPIQRAATTWKRGCNTWLATAFARRSSFPIYVWRLAVHQTRR